MRDAQRTGNKVLLLIGLCMLTGIAGMVWADQAHAPSLPPVADVEPEVTCSASAQRDGGKIVLTRACSDGFTESKPVIVENGIAMWMDERSIMAFRITLAGNKVLVADL